MIILESDMQINLASRMRSSFSIYSQPSQNIGFKVREVRVREARFICISDWRLAFVYLPTEIYFSI